MLQVAQAGKQRRDLTCGVFVVEANQRSQQAWPDAADRQALPVVGQVKAHSGNHIEVAGSGGLPRSTRSKRSRQIRRTQFATPTTWGSHNASNTLEASARAHRAAIANLARGREVRFARYQSHN